MSNEELVAEIQAGASERMGELWTQIDGLVKQQAQKVMSALALRRNSCGVEFEDLYQTGYIALTEAVKTYNPKGMSFAAWLVLYLKSAFAAATGYRTTTGQNEPLNNALSLDMPPNDETDGLTLGDEVTVLGHVGRFSKQKNQVILIDIFKEYKKMNYNSKLCLITVWITSL